MTIEITSMTALQSTPGTTNELCHLLGYYTPGDGGGGEFYWDDNGSSLLQGDGGTIISVNGTTGKWVRLSDDDFNIRWFGATGKGVQDDTSYIQNCINAALKRNKNVYTPSGIYLVSSLNITFASGDASFNIRGDGSYNTILKKDATTPPILTLTSPKDLNSFCEISHIRFMDTNADSDGIFVNLAARFTIRNCSFNGLRRGIYSQGGLIYFIYNCEFKDCYYGLLIRDGVSGISGVHSNLIEIANCTFGFIFKWAIDMGGGSMLKLENNDFEVNGTNTDTDSGCIMIRNTVDDEIGEAIININRCWLERNNGWDIIAEPNQTTIFNIEQCNLGLNAAQRSINIQGGKRANISGILLRDIATVNINCATSLIQGSTISNLNDTSSYKTHINVSPFNADINLNGGAGFQQGVRIVNNESLYFSFDNPSRIVNKIRPNLTDNGLIMDLQAGSFTVASDVLAKGNLQCQGSSWNTSHFVLGFYHFWVDSAGKLRIKGGQPLSDTDGTIVGSQL